MRVLVTGHEGYIGSVLVPELLERGHEVVGCDFALFDACRFTGSLARVPNIGKDVRALAASDLEGFDSVIHLAALSNDPLGDFQPRLTQALNHRAAVDIARHAAGAGVQRFLFASSCSVYGAAPNAWLNEGSRVNPITPYGLSKARAELEISALASHAFSPTHVRSGTVYGASPRIRFDLVLNNLVAWAAATGTVHLKSDGRAWRPLVHVSDVARAYCDLMEAPRPLVHDQVFNIGVTTENYRVLELAEIVQRTVPASRIERAATPGPDRRDYRVDCGKLADTIGAFEPRWTAEQGAAELYAALSLTPVPPGDFEGPLFSRIAHLKQLIAAGRLDRDLRWTACHDGR